MAIQSFHHSNSATAHAQTVLYCKTWRPCAAQEVENHHLAPPLALICSPLLLLYYYGAVISGIFIYPVSSYHHLPVLVISFVTLKISFFLDCHPVFYDMSCLNGTYLQQQV